MQTETNIMETLSTASQSADPSVALDQLRDLLFGTQMRDYEGRFGNLEDALVRETANVKELLERQLSSLESARTKEVEKFESRLESEKNARRDLVKDCERELKALTDSLSSKITELERSTSNAQADIRDLQSAQSSKMSIELRRVQDELTALLDQQTGQLRHDKVDRVMLGSLLTNVVKKISDDASSRAEEF